MRKINRLSAFRIGMHAVFFLVLSAVIPAEAEDGSLGEGGLELREVKWESGDRELVVKGRDAGRYAAITVSNAALLSILWMHQ